MGKFKMPSVHKFLKSKKIYDAKRDPVWVYLEQEMKAKVDKKPYNNKVGSWLKFLKDLRYHYHCEAKKKAKRLEKEVGPPWYTELGIRQRAILDDLKLMIHQDLLEDVPTRIRRCLSDLGVTLRFSKSMLMRAMTTSFEDPGLFIWNLYKFYYKKPPSRLQESYDMNAMLLMSALTFIDLEECIQALDKLTKQEKKEPSPPAKKKSMYSEPRIRYGVYLQKLTVPVVSSHPSEEEVKRKKPCPLQCKIKLRSDASYEKLCLDNGFLNKRKDRNMKQKQSERICHYKFWEPPATLRNVDPKMAAYVMKLKMFKKKARPRYMKFKAPFNCIQYNLGTVSYTGELPRFVINNVALLPTGYIPVHGGVLKLNGEYITNILGFWKFPKYSVEKCDSACDCLAKWESSAIDYLKDTKCKCGHLYDYYNEGKLTEKYFNPPSEHTEHWIDRAKVYQLDPAEDFVRETVFNALKSNDTTPVPSIPAISASGLKERELLAAFLADLYDSPLLIPHLPKANLLNNLQEWIRKRMKGDISPAKHKQWLLQAQRRWLDLKHMDFRARAYRIPFTYKQLANINWSHRYMVQDLFNILLNDFVYRNRLKQLEQTRLWWPTMKYDAYPSKAFLDIFFTYMPSRLKDTYLINPYSSENTPKFGAKTCPL